MGIRLLENQYWVTFSSVKSLLGHGVGLELIQTDDKASNFKYLT